ncbi:tetratricopeptide repeat protein [Flavobacteriaceae bacterium KMM 6898]|nr:tetratricopeptide repeat protein [Flavobacteriaceae bacterium KMM 6898]
MKCSPVFLICLITSLFLQAQNNQQVDSLYDPAQYANSSTPLSAQVYYDIGTTFLKNKEFENAYENFNFGLQKAIETNNEPLTALGTYHVGDYFLQTNDIPQALTFFNTALVSFENLDKKADVAKCYYKIGKSYSRISDFEKALFYSFESLRRNEALKEEKEIIKVSTQIGAIYLVTGDYKNSNFNFKHALKLQEKNNDDKGLILTYLNLGALSQKQKHFEEALAYFQSGLEKVGKFSTVDVDSIDLLDNKSILLGNIGSTLRAQDKFEASLDYLFQALALKKEVNRNRSTAHTCNDIAETFIKMNNYAKAKDYALEAVRYAKNVSINQESWGYYLISKCDYALQDYKSSYDNFQIYNRLKDSIFNTQKAARINELQIQYKTEKRDFQIETQKKDIAFLDTQNKLKSQLLWFGGIGLLSVFGFVLVLKSREKVKKDKKIQERFSQELIEAQESERTRVALELHDGVGQQLMMLVRKAKNDGDQISESLSTNTLEHVRNISRNLHPASIEQLGFTAAVKELINDFDELTDTIFKIDIETIDDELDKKNELHLYRIFQESLSNMVKHANASHATISLKKEHTFIMLSIKDTGKGFDYSEKKKKSKSLGMKSLVERCHIMKAKLKIHSTPSKGTEIMVFLPIAS